MDHYIAGQLYRHVNTYSKRDTERKAKNMVKPTYTHKGDTNRQYSWVDSLHNEIIIILPMIIVN